MQGALMKECWVWTWYHVNMIKPSVIQWTMSLALSQVPLDLGTKYILLDPLRTRIHKYQNHRSSCSTMQWKKTWCFNCMKEEKIKTDNRLCVCVRERSLGNSRGSTSQRFISPLQLSLSGKSSNKVFMYSADSCAEGCCRLYTHTSERVLHTHTFLHKLSLCLSLCSLSLSHLCGFLLCLLQHYTTHWGMCVCVCARVHT